jgi:hypothetical protein
MYGLVEGEQVDWNEPGKSGLQHVERTSLFLTVLRFLLAESYARTKASSRMESRQMLCERVFFTDVTEVPKRAELRECQAPKHNRYMRSVLCSTYVRACSTKAARCAYPMDRVQFESSLGGTTRSCMEWSQARGV